MVVVIRRRLPLHFWPHIHLATLRQWRGHPQAVSWRRVVGIEDDIGDNADRFDELGDDGEDKTHRCLETVGKLAFG
jgi:hypothetical protein